MSWRPRLGALPEPDGTRFRVWAPAARALEVAVAGRGAPVPLTRGADGGWEAAVAGVRAGDRYGFRLDGEGPFPDPASRSQPDGVHGPSEVVDPGAFAWTDGGWGGATLAGLVVYELHVGTFTPAGTFAAAAARLPALADLGVTAVELMPVADFPGTRNWGYDGAALFAPARCYGRPDDLRRLVDTAHGLGLAVLLDVVYNHFGPDGAYAPRFAPTLFSTRHRSPWGDGINLDGEGAAGGRAFLIENALVWLHEYHVDGLRLDATHALVDDGPHHFLAELAARVRADGPAARHPLLVAEDARNLACMVTPAAAGGWGLDAVWSDDFHHACRRLLAGDRDGYFADYAGTAADVATTIRQGWLFTGQHASFFGSARGTNPAGIAPPRFVFCLQNHDQIGNRAFGERLHHQIDLAAFRAATALLLAAPQTPLLFMGQEWAASTPFRFFTDHAPALGRLVTEGRRREFARFAAFAGAAARARIPDPQAPATFADCRLRWEERDAEPHAAVLRLHRALLRLRRTEPALRTAPAGAHDATAPDAATVVVRRSAPGAAAVVAVARLTGAGPVEIPCADGGTAHVLLTTEDADFACDPEPPRIETLPAGLRIHFARPGAVLMRFACSENSARIRGPLTLSPEPVEGSKGERVSVPVPSSSARRGTRRGARSSCRSRGDPAQGGRLS